MFDYTGWIARSTAGHDKDTLLCVIGMDQEAERLLVADGKRRKVMRPKRKKLGHLNMVSFGTFGHQAIRKLKEGRPVSDRELRRALAAFRDESDQGGN